MLVCRVYPGVPDDGLWAESSNGATESADGIEFTRATAVEIVKEAICERLLKVTPVSPAENVGPENERCREENEDQNGGEEREAGRVHGHESKQRWSIKRATGRGGAHTDIALLCPSRSVRMSGTVSWSTCLRR